MKLLRHSGSPPVASCPNCNRLCINIKDAEKAAIEEKEKNKMWKRGEFVYFLAGLLALISGMIFDYYAGYNRGEAKAKARLPYTIWYRWTVLDPKDDPPIKEMTVAHTMGGHRPRTKGYVAGNNAVVKEWLAHNKFVPFPPVSKASDLGMYK